MYKITYTQSDKASAIIEKILPADVSQHRAVLNALPADLLYADITRDNLVIAVVVRSPSAGLVVRKQDPSYAI